ncbi:hypothetical protein [[Mycoplasma] anseris]|uniref:Uncharacterized protein n=1 Tax=[Mycoplasma] anseris TaxID=92400 RepID=A0A2Z4NDF7_9BACT|nr:hypothetical protein [[Mycoplasma] anseris]AWX69435.1 hypothetical protein DP065_01540 [[Mycoplasma] anseris]
MRKEIKRIALVSLIFSIIYFIVLCISLFALLVVLMLKSKDSTKEEVLIIAGIKKFLISIIVLFPIVIAVLNILLTIKMHRISAQALLILGIFFIIPSFFILPRILNNQELIKFSALKAEEDLKIALSSEK